MVVMNSDNQLPDNEGTENAVQMGVNSARIENILNEEQRLELLRAALRAQERPTLSGVTLHELRAWQARQVVAFALPVATVIAEYGRMFDEDRDPMTLGTLPYIKVVHGVRILNNGLGRRCELRHDEEIDLLDLTAVDDRIDQALFW